MPRNAGKHKEIFINNWNSHLPKSIIAQMAEFERIIYFPVDDFELIHLNVIPPDQKPEDYDPARDMGENYSVYELMLLGGESLKKGVDRVHEAMEEVRNSKNIMGQPTDPERRLLQDELDVLMYEGEFVIFH